MTYCATCGRQHPSRRVKLIASLPWETLPLGAWQSPPPRPASRTVPPILLLHDCPNEDGEPRAGYYHPDERRLRLCASISEAHAEVNRIWGGR
ncbi:hypothetical protein [Paracraurococcus ruber]|uniref:hypothetical protein n=1 Tax=Paracraurococcus ruber TaxID=77675 RepID=UPI0010576A8F|nr:hypothetical protein [Paracraurococcus ruber]TDG30610.1 hypothetical protein E2C05_13850 [Paracraurococcus ruber]